MTENEKRGFLNGCRFMFNMMCIISKNLKARGDDRLANCFESLIKTELKKLGIANAFYEELGGEMFAPSDGEEKCSSLTANAPHVTAMDAPSATARE